MAYEDTLYKVEINTPQGLIECVGGSYGGVPFFVEDGDSIGGRQIKTTEIPFSDSHVNEDNGRKFREFSLRFYLVGEDVEQQREKLEEVFNSEGPFEFVHPNYGSMMARCGIYSIRISSAEQEYISGNVTFIPENEVENAAKAYVDEKSEAVMKANSYVEESSKKMNSVVSSIEINDVLIDEISNSIGNYVSAIESAREMMIENESFSYKIDYLKSNIAYLVSNPYKLAESIQQCIISSSNKVSFNDYVFESLKIIDSIYFEDGELESDILKNSVSSLVMITSASMALRSVVDSEFENSDEVYEMKNKFENSFVSAMEKTNDFEDYQTMSIIMSMATKYLDKIAQELPKLVDMEMLCTRNAISLCYDCYGNTDRIEEILNRNEIVDPVVMTRKIIKVLSE